MIYSTGTISINRNTATGSGTNWTAPASQVRAGQTIIVMSNPVQLFQISSVNSATSMTVTPAVSPALSGQKYGILVSDNISVDGLAQAMSQLIKEYDENIGAWETFATTSANQSITVTINGTAVTIPGIGKLAQKGSNGALAIADGGTGATKAEDALTNLGISNAVIGDGVNVIGFIKGVINKPYFRHQDTDTVILLTTQEELRTALAGKQDSNDTLSALANLIATTNKLPYFNNENSADLTDFTKVGRDIISKSSIHDVIQYLELDDMVTGDGASVIGFSRNDATKPYMRHAQSDSVVALATASQLIGTDQTYQIVTDKYPGITYTNTSKQPWVISLKVNLPASGEVQIKVNGVTAAGGNTPNYAGVSSWVYPCAIVPPGDNYMVELSFGNVIEWIELK